MGVLTSLVAATQKTQTIPKAMAVYHTQPKASRYASFAAVEAVCKTSGVIPSIAAIALGSVMVPVTTPKSPGSELGGNPCGRTAAVTAFGRMLAALGWKIVVYMAVPRAPPKFYEAERAN